MVTDPRAQALIEFILQRILRQPHAVIQEDTKLVSTGLVDSFALVDLLLKLEEVTGKRLPMGHIGSSDFETVQAMLRAADRF